MNKNAIFALIGVGVFVALLVVIWGQSGSDRGPAFEPAKPSAESETKGPAEKGPEPMVVPPPPKRIPGSDNVTTRGTDSGGAEGEGPSPAEGGEKPAEGGEKETPKDETPQKKPLEKTRITANPDAIDEASKVAAAGRQEVPMPWLKEEEKEGEKEEKKYPDTYVVEKPMSLYRVAEIVYGDADKWPLLFEANKANLEDPEKVETGTRLTVPDPDTPMGKPEKKKKTNLSDGLF
ncbi:MAG: LysM peptidoglycan-binding domain-containing protein [Planctomycetota bacterium]|jgi:nucleoid-associated protein YgaU